MAALDFPASPTVGQTTADGRFRWNGVGWVRVKTPTVVPIIQGGTGASTAAGARDNLAIREKLSAARTYYVRTDGIDSNTGLANTAGGAFRTIQKAVDVAASLDLGLFEVTILVGAGTWTAPTYLKSLVGAARVVISGINADMTSTVINTTNASCFSGLYAGSYHVQWMRLQTTTSGQCLSAQGGAAALTWSNIDFGPCGSMHIVSSNSALVSAAGSYTISGGAAAHVAVYDSGFARIGDIPVSITGNPNFFYAFAVAERVSSLYAGNISFSGTATGARYIAVMNGTITTNGGETYLPGSSAGSRVTGGQYV